MNKITSLVFILTFLSVGCGTKVPSPEAAPVENPSSSIISADINFNPLDENRSAQVGISSVSNNNIPVEINVCVESVVFTKDNGIEVARSLNQELDLFIDLGTRIGTFELPEGLYSGLTLKLTENCDGSSGPSIEYYLMNSERKIRYGGFSRESIDLRFNNPFEISNNSNFVNFITQNLSQTLSQAHDDPDWVDQLSENAF